MTLSPDCPHAEARRPCPQHSCRLRAWGGICVLDLVDSHPDGMTLDEIADALHMSRASAWNALETAKRKLRP